MTSKEEDALIESVRQQVEKALLLAREFEIRAKSSS